MGWFCMLKKMLPASSFITNSGERCEQQQYGKWRFTKECQFAQMFHEENGSAAPQKILLRMSTGAVSLESYTTIFITLVLFLCETNKRTNLWTSFVQGWTLLASLILGCFSKRSLWIAQNYSYRFQLLQHLSIVFKEKSLSYVLEGRRKVKRTYFRADA